MTINKNSWHYKLCALMFYSMNGNYPKKTDLCSYFWTVVGSLLMVTLFVALLGLFLIVAMPIYALVYASGYLLGLRMNESGNITLRHGSINGLKIYPAYVWLALAAGGTLAWLGLQPSLLVWLTLGTAAAVGLWVLWLSLGLKIDKTSAEIVMTHIYLGGYKVYPFLIWVSLALLGAFGYITLRWGELGLIRALVFLVGGALAVSLRQCFMDRVDKWDIDRQKRHREIAPNRGDRFGFWSVIKAYLRARKGKFCPTVTFNDKPTNLKN